MFNTVATHVVFLTLLTCVLIVTPKCAWTLFSKLSGLCAIFTISYLLSNYVDNALPRFRVKASKKAVFITGCDTGFGHFLAQRLASLGFKVFAGCLFPNGKGAENLRYTTGSNLHIVDIDVTKEESVQEAVRVVQNSLEDCELWALVNNAGVLARGELEWMPFEEYRKQFEVNTFGVVRVTQAFLPLIRKWKGRVVTTTSTGGRFTFSGFVPYCMSKHAANSFCDGLRLEMAKFGVKVITVEPFSYQTGMTEMTNALKSVEETWTKSSDRYGNDTYDRRYMEAFKESVRKFNALTCLPNSYEVVDALVEAVCAISPHYSYAPGSFTGRLQLWFSRRVPKTFVDYMVRRTITFDTDVAKFLQDASSKKIN